MRIFLYEKSIENRTVIRNIIHQILPFSEIQECGIYKKASQIIAETKFDIVLLDLDTLAGNLLEITAQARYNNPMTTFIVMSLFPVDEIKEKLLQYGIIHYLDKSNQDKELGEVLNMVNVAAMDYANDLDQYRKQQIFSVFSS